MEQILSVLKILQVIATILILFLSMYYIINIGNKYVRFDNRFIITKRHIYAFLVLVALIALIFSILNSKSILKDIILSIIYSIILAYILNPIVNLLEGKGIKRSWSIFIIYLTLIIAVILIAIKIIPETYKEFENLIDLIPSYTSKIYDTFNGYYLKYIKKIESMPKGFDGINKIFSENLKKIEIYSLKKLREITNTILKLISKSLTLIIVPILSFYFLQDKEYFKKNITMLIPKKYRSDILKLGREIDFVLNRFLRGQVITSIIVGVLTMIGLLIIRLEFAILISLVVALFEIIPYFGPIIGAVLAVIFGLLDSPSKAIWGLIVITIVQQLESNIISPKIVGDSVGIHPVFIMLLVILGGGYFGVVGMLLAIPVSATIKILASFILDKVSEQ